MEEARQEMPTPEPMEEQRTDDSPVESDSERFDQELIRRSFDFGQEILKSIPELEVLGLVPIWGVPQADLMPVIYLTREGAGMSPHQIMLAMDRFVRGMDYKVNRVRELFLATGEALNKQAGEISANQETIETQAEKIAGQEAAIQELTIRHAELQGAPPEEDEESAQTSGE